MYRATRQALRQQALLHAAKAGPYSDVSDRDTAYIERCDEIMSGEQAKWLGARQQQRTTERTEPSQ